MTHATEEQIAALRARIRQAGHKNNSLRGEDCQSPP
jgi:hypothetical protein